MTNWVMDTKAVTYPNGELKRVVFRKSEKGEIQINESIDVDVLGLSVDDAIQVLTEAKSRLTEPVLLADTYVDTSKETIIEMYVDGWRTEFSEFEQQVFANE